MAVRVFVAVQLCMAISVCASARAPVDVVFAGSTIVEMSDGFQPDLIYRKYPTDEPVTPTAMWQLGFGVARGMPMARPSMAGPITSFAIPRAG